MRGIMFAGEKDGDEDVCCSSNWQGSNIVISCWRETNDSFWCAELKLASALHLG